MAKYVPDVKTQRWVIISRSRVSRPQDAQEEPVPAKPKVDPFAEGNEHLTPPEVYRIGEGEKDAPGWQVRVVPNKYPITDIHEVFIHSTDETKDIEDLDREQVVRIIRAYRDRYRAHESDGQVLIFCNHGKHAGASLNHPHSQLVVVPKQINLDALSREPVANIVHENATFVVYCPDFSQWPFETWIAGKNQGSKFSDLSDEELPALAYVLQSALVSIKGIYHDQALASVHAGSDFAYNFYISHGDNWFIRIVPRFVHRAGFELGTGLNVNVLDPTDAAVYLKEKWPTDE